MIRMLCIADIFSLINAIFGFIAIIMAFSGEIRLSFSFILLAMLADGLDGIIARKISQSDLGEYLESMADMTSLCIAPAVFIFHIYFEVVSISIYFYIYLLIVLFLFLSFGIIRLASFHVMKKKDYFIGLPASVSTIILIICAVLKVDFFYLLFIIIVVSFALVSSVRFPKPDIKINISAVVLVFLTLIMWKTYQNVALIIFLFSVIIYAICGPIYLFINKQ